PLHARKRPFKVRCQPIDDGLSPPFASLPLGDRFPNLPVQGDQVAIDGERGLDLRRTDALLEVIEQRGIAGGEFFQSSSGPSHNLGPCRLPAPTAPFSHIPSLSD